MLKKFIAVCFFFASCALAAGSDLIVENAWIRYLPGDGPMAGYFVLSNPTGQERTLVGASSPAFEEIQLHRTVHKDGMSSMEAVEAVPVQAHGEVTFRPGGYHLMLMRRKVELSAGDEAYVTLEFEGGGTQEVRFTVKPPWQE